MTAYLYSHVKRSFNTHQSFNAFRVICICRLALACQTVTKFGHKRTLEGNPLPTSKWNRYHKSQLPNSLLFKAILDGTNIPLTLSPEVNPTLFFFHIPKHHIILFFWDPARQPVHNICDLLFSVPTLTILGNRFYLSLWPGNTS